MTALPSETTFQKALWEALDQHQFIRVWRQNCGGVTIRDRAGQHLGHFDAGPPAGAADLSGLVFPGGIRLEVEVKVKKPWSTQQQTWKAFIEMFGGVYVLVRWDPNLNMAANVARGVRLVEEAVDARRGALPTLRWLAKHLTPEGAAALRARWDALFSEAA